MIQTPRPHSAEIFGGEIQYFRLDARYWRPILQKFKDAGLSCVTTYVQWATHLVGPSDERHPAGVLDFEGKTNPNLNLFQFLDLVQEMELELTFRCGPFCCNEMVHGGYPSWLVMGDPMTMVWDYQNRTTQGYWIGKREGSQPSYLHPEYLSWCSKWISEVDKIIAPRLKSKGGFITMLNLDNEVSYIVQDGFLSSDYNPVNVRPGGFYHQFLAEKYGAAGGLPYPVKYAAIEDVPAPRLIPSQIGDDFAYYADWCEFKTWVMSKYIGIIREMHEANGVKEVTFITNFNPHRPEGVPTRMPAFEKSTGPLGITGYDFYRGTFLSYSGYHSMARVLKLMNATLRYTWSTEFMSGTWNKVLTTRVSDDHMKFMALCALAQGCKAISWFMFHDRDCWGDAPVSSHAHERPSIAVLREIKAVACETIQGWDELVPVTDLAVVYDLTSHVHSYLGDPSPCDDSAIHVGEPSVDGTPCGLASLEYEGLFRVVEHTGRQASVIDPVHSISGILPELVPLVILPGSPVIHRTTAVALETYVKNGGRLIVSGPWPTRNDLGHRIDFLEGLPVESGRPVPMKEGSVCWVKNGLGGGKPEEDSLESIAFLKSLLDRELPPPHVLVEADAEVAWVDWNTGKTMKSEGGHCTYRQPRNLFTAVLHKGAKDHVLFVLNHYPEAARARITLRDRSASILLDLQTGETIPLTNGKVVLDLDRKSAAVFRVLSHRNGSIEFIVRKEDLHELVAIER